MYRYILLLFIIHSQSAYSQEPKLEHEVGVNLGVVNYYGDLNTQFGLSGIGPSASVFWRGNYGHRFAIKTALSRMYVSASDVNSSSLFQQQRNLSFKSAITDLNAQLEFNFLHFVKNVFYNNQGSTFTPYISVGLGAFFFNPQTDYNGKTYDLQPLGTEGQTDRSYTDIGRYNLYALSFNYGAGLKVHMKRNLSIGIDFNIHRTFTDYLDDVSGQYVPVISLNQQDKGMAYLLYDRSKELGKAIGEPGKQRGSMNGNDDFATLMISLSWTFVKPFCPGAE